MIRTIADAGLPRNCRQTKDGFEADDDVGVTYFISRHAGYWNFVARRENESMWSIGGMTLADICADIERAS